MWLKSISGEGAAKPRLKLNRRVRRRKAFSEITSVLLAFVMTFGAGLAVWGFAREQAAVSQQQIGGALSGNVNYLNEQFVVAQASYTSTSVTLYIYNTGQVPVRLSQIELFNATRAKIDLTYTATKVTDLNHVGSCSVTPTTSLEAPALVGTSPTSYSVPAGTISSITLTFPSCYLGTFKSGFIYYVKLLGQYGNSVTYFQGM